MMMDLESLLGGDGEAFATIDDLDGLLNDYAAAPGAAVAPGAPEIAFPKAVLKVGRPRAWPAASCAWGGPARSAALAHDPFLICIPAYGPRPIPPRAGVGLA